MEFKFNVKSFKRMENPYDVKWDRTKYVCYVNARVIPLEFEQWMETNPREQKLTTNVAKAIQDSLSNNHKDFHELNRGIVMSASKVSYDNQTKEITMEFEDESIHGNIDGGHTLRIILEQIKNGELLHEKYVFLEIFTGIENPIELAEARNTSVQVTQTSIEELKNSFECIKEALSNCSFKDRIAYKQNEHTGEKNIIDVREIIAITNMFNQSLYPINNQINISHPIQSYTGKETSLNSYLKIEKEDREKIIENMSGIIPDIFKLWDMIETEFDSKAKLGKKIYKVKKYSKFDENRIVEHSMISNNGLDYSVPKGLIYPLVGAFRAIVEIDPVTGKYRWKKDPFQAWNIVGPNLIRTLLNASTDLGDTPDTIGKSPNTWDILFKELFIYGFSNN